MSQAPRSPGARGVADSRRSARKIVQRRYASVRRLVCCCSFIGLTAPLAAQQPIISADTSAKSDSLKLRARDLTAVTVVASPVDRLQPSGITHVGAGSLALLPANSTWDLLRQAAGIEVHQQGQGPGFASDASLRGFSSDHSTDLALWIDGVPINEPVNGHAEGYNDWSLLFRSAVRDVDVIKGPTSPLFGNFALSGVVNVRTIERMRGSAVTAEAGSFGAAGATLLTGFDHGERGGGVFGLHVGREDGFRPNSGFTIGQGHLRVVHEVGARVSVDAGVELYDAGWRSPGFLSESDLAARDFSIVTNPTDGGHKQRAQERVSVRFISGSLIWRSTVYATQGQWRLFLTIPPAGGLFEGSGDQTEERDGRTGVGATSAATWLMPNAELTIGAELRWDRARYENYFSTERTRDSAQALVHARQQSGALFAQSHWHLGERWRVDLGARADAIGTRSAPDGEHAQQGTAAIVSPKGGVLFRISPTVGLYADVSRGFRSTDGVLTDPSLPLISAWAYEGGVKLTRGAAIASASAFLMDVSNEQTFDPIGRGSSSGGSSQRRGIELSWTMPVAPRVHIGGEWTFNDARYRHEIVADDDGIATPLDRMRVYNTAQYVGASSLECVAADGRWRVRVSGDWMGPYSPFDEPGVVIGGYGLAHVAFSTRVLGAAVDLGVRNLFNRVYPELVAGHLVSPGQPRSMRMTVRRAF